MNHLSPLLAAAAFAACIPAHAQSIDFITKTDVANGAEILSFTTDQNTVASTVSGGGVVAARIFTLNADGSLTARTDVSFATEFGGALLGISSVALDPLGRGFGVASLIPTANGTTAGRVAFFDYRTGSAGVLVALNVGFHPDSVVFSKDGTKVFVANEGEFTSGGATDAPGSVTVIDLTGKTTPALIATLTAANVTTVDFSTGNLAAGVDLTALRFNDNTAGAIANRFRHVEPEYITEGDGKIYVSLQENNAFAELSLVGANALKWTAIRPLGTIAQTIDASDRDGAGATTAALIDDVVKGMPMPDTLASFTSDGSLFLVTANEGDFRVDDGDRKRVSAYAGSEVGFTPDRADAVLGRLRVLTDVSDPDNDNLLDDIVMPGTRSFSIWNATTGALAFDSGSLESLLLAEDPTRHNQNAEGGAGTFDTRSPDKGPEPEALATGLLNGRRYVFVGLERQDGLVMFDAQDPTAATFSDYVNNFSDGLVAPECILFLSAADSPTGFGTLLVGYEISGTIGTYRVEGAPLPPVTATPPAIVPPTIQVKKKISAGADDESVTVRGRASAGTVRVLVNGKLAKGTRSWKAEIKFPAGKDTLRVRVIAIAADGTRSAPKMVAVSRK